MDCSIKSSHPSLISNRYHGAGNSFLIFEESLSGDPSELCRCGVDGILLLRGNRYHIFNADGSEAEMCGNGIRCAVRYLADRGRRKERYFFDTLAGPVEAWHEGDLIGVQMPQPQLIKTSLFKEKEADYYLVGVPHVVLFFDEIACLDIEKWADPAYNVNLVQLKDDAIVIRTFERGVNRETLSCGTGSTAAAHAAKRRFRLGDEVCVHTESKSDLIIRLLPDRTEMIGPAEQIILQS